jgi:putative heme-binding domain-containing protein
LKTNDGATILKEALESGEAPVELLQVRRVKTLVDERLKRTRDQNWEELLKRSEGSVSELENLLVAREFGALTYKGSVDKGRAVFSTNCASCHQIKGVGGLVGPQLDGIGNWGVKALTEKILSPNRNVTEAFKTYQITMRSGDKKLGLYRRTEGATMVFADHAGQEFSVQKEQIETYEPINMTIMPDQFRYSIPENDFYELIAYLSAVK